MAIQKKFKFFSLILMIILLISFFYSQELLDKKIQDYMKKPSDFFLESSQKDIWKIATSEEKIAFFREYKKEKGLNFEIKGLEGSDLTWDGTKIGTIDNNGKLVAWIDLNKVPKFIIQIQYKDGWFTLKDNQEISFSFKKNSIGDDGTFNGLDVFVKNEGQGEGSISFDGERFFIKGSAMLKLSEDKYLYKGSLDTESVVKIIEENGKKYYLGSNVGVFYGETYATIPAKESKSLSVWKDTDFTRIYFGNDDFDLTGQGIQIGDKIIRAEGHGMDITLGKKFEEISIKPTLTVKEAFLGEGLGNGLKITLRNGQFEMQFVADKIIVPPNAGEIKYKPDFEIDKIYNKNSLSSDYLILNGNKEEGFTLTNKDNSISITGTSEFRGGLQFRVNRGKGGKIGIGEITAGFQESALRTIQRKDYSSDEAYQEARRKYADELQGVGINKEMTFKPTSGISSKVINDYVIGNIEPGVEKAYNEVDQKMASALSDMFSEFSGDSVFKEFLGDRSSSLLQSFSGVEDYKSINPEDARRLTKDMSILLEKGTVLLPSQIKLPDSMRDEYQLPEYVDKNVVKSILVLNNNRESLKGITYFIDRGYFDSSHSLTMRVSNGIGIVEAYSTNTNSGNMEQQQYVTSGELVNALISLGMSKYPRAFDENNVRVYGHKELKAMQGSGVF